MMINPQILANVASSVAKNETKLDSKALKSDLNSKESILTGALKQKLGLKSPTTAHTTALNPLDEDLNVKLKNLVNKVLEQLFAKNTPNEKFIKQASQLNFAPNFSNEIKFLASEMKKSEVFSELLAKLEQILKPASEVKAENLAPLFKNSGIFFEAKLKDALNKDILPKSFHSLLNAIKSLSSPQISSQIIALADKDLDAKSSLNELKSIINAQKHENRAILANTNFKSLLALATKLENFKNYISKNPSFAQNHIQSIATNILKQIQKIEANFKQELKRPENLALKDTQFLNNLNQSFFKLVNTLKALSSGDFSIFKHENTQNPPKLNEVFSPPTQESVKESPKSDEKSPLNENLKEVKGKISSPQNKADEGVEQNKIQNDTDESVELNKTQDNTDESQNKTQTTKEQTQPLKQENAKTNTTLSQIQDENETTLKQNALKDEKTSLLNAPKSEVANKALQEKPNPQTLTQTSPMQEKPLNEQNKPMAEVKNLIFSTEKAQMPELESLNKELSTLTRRINESLKQLDSDTQNAKINLADLKNLEHKIERATKDLAQIVPKNEADIAKELKNDIKSTLLQVLNTAKSENNEAVANQASRLLAQIEFNQLISLANESINTYLPLFWEDLNESRVIFKRGKKDKYFAQIKLHFAKLGELDIFIALKQDKYLDINIMAEDKAFRKAIYEHSHELRRSLSKVGLLSSNFFVGDIVRSKLAPQEFGRNYDFQMGVDKKA